MLWAGDACVSCCGQQILGNPVPHSINESATSGFYGRALCGVCQNPMFCKNNRDLHSLPHEMLLHQEKGRGVCTLGRRAGTLGDSGFCVGYDIFMS